MPLDGCGGTNGGLFPFVTIPGTTSTAVPARNRSIRNGIVPPPWDKMNLMSGNRSVVPLQIRLPIVLVVSVAYRSEEHTSELQSLMRISYAVFCLKKKTLLISQHTTCNIY